MTSQLPGAFTPSIPPQEESDSELLRLCDLLGIGVVRVDPGGLAVPINVNGGELLTTLGGNAGAPAPDPLPELLRAAATEGPQVGETMTRSPASRHIAVTASNGLVLLRDNTDERLLHERLLQSEKMASVGQLVSGVAHELNNPLTGVMGFSQLLLAGELGRGPAGTNPDDLRRGRTRGEDRTEPAFVCAAATADEGDGRRQRTGAARAGAAQL